MIARGTPRHVAARAPEHDDLPQRRDLRSGCVSHRLHWHDLSTPEKSIRRDQCAGIRIAQSRGDRLRSVSGKERQKNRADLDDREHGHHALRSHWHEDTDRVALSQADRAQRIRRLVHLAAQLAIRQHRHRALLALPSQRYPRVRRSPGVFIEAVVDDIHSAAHAPLRPLDAAGEIHDLRIRRVKLDAQIAQDRVPEPRDVTGGPPLQLLKRGDAVREHEAPEMALRDDLRRGPPHDPAAGFERLHGAHARSRRSTRRIFPLMVFGSSVRNSISRGYL